MTVAIIDLGTNTFNLIVVQLQAAQKFSILYNDKISVKLGEGGIEKNMLLPAAFERGISAIEKHLAKANSFFPDKILAFATSAIRSAHNGNVFVAQVKSRFKLEVQVIDGNKEAELIYKGVKLGLKLPQHTCLIMDIGGGSTEFILANNNHIFWKSSFNLGVARLLEKFSTSDPITSTEILAITNYLHQQLLPLHEAVKKYPVKELIGSSGSFDTFAEIISFKKNMALDLSKQTEYAYDLADFEEIYEELIASTKQQRMQTPGIIEMRVDMIVVAAVFTNYVLKNYRLSSMKLSTYALKEGVIAEMINS
ncbi:MAG TPA: phosphatase [Bacteroidia bacterium]|nr:phosphatase [Bacteroidia bacterium]HRH09103.1 phosphatase [Bacteroidia bacterium]